LGYKKPRREAFDESIAIARSNASTAIMIGDDLECDVAGAMDAGWRSIYFNPHGVDADPKFQQIAHLRELLDLPLT
jgi:putative hydrolase of the HAD superfamily